MIKRWLIRSLPMTLLTLCVVAWVGSYWRIVWLCHCTARPAPLSDGLARALALVNGRMCYFQYVSDGQPIGWEASITETGGDFESFLMDSYYVARYQCAGFSFEPGPRISVSTPLWFPTFLSAVLLGLVRRKTKRKLVGRAFPVEPAAKPGESKP